MIAFVKLASLTSSDWNDLLALLFFAVQLRVLFDIDFKLQHCQTQRRMKCKATCNCTNSLNIRLCVVTEISCYLLEPVVIIFGQAEHSGDEVDKHSSSDSFVDYRFHWLVRFLLPFCKFHLFSGFFLFFNRKLSTIYRCMQWINDVGNRL